MAVDYKKSNAASTTVTRDIKNLYEPTGNLYESLVVVSRRANQISKELKEELTSKLAEFASATDNLEEVFENREQIEISRFYEKLPKPSSLAIQEFTEDRVYHRNPARDEQQAAEEEES